MANLNKQLKDIFNSYLKRLAEEKSSSYSSRSAAYQGRFNFEDDFKGIIYFYEWSDINRAPTSYYTLKAFETFLNKSQIFLAGFQRELITHMNNPHIICKKNSHELIIKPTYTSLKEAIDKDSTIANAFAAHNKGSEANIPYTCQIAYAPKSTIQRPPMYCKEVENRWQEQQEFWEW